MNSRTLRWRFHFNAMHNMSPEKEEGKHTHSFLVILCMEVESMDLDQQNKCEKALKEYFEQFNGKYLNELDAFKGELPTIEKIAEAIYPETEKLASDYGMQQIMLQWKLLTDGLKQKYLMIFISQATKILSRKSKITLCSLTKSVLRIL